MWLYTVHTSHSCLETDYTQRIVLGKNAAL